MLQLHFVCILLVSLVIVRVHPGAEPNTDIGGQAAQEHRGLNKHVETVRDSLSLSHTLSFLQFFIKGSIKPLILFRICCRQILSCLKSSSVMPAFFFSFSTAEATTFSLFLSFFLLLFSMVKLYHSAYNNEVPRFL